MKIVYIGLGSNLGDRAKNMQIARELLNAEGLHVLRESSIYATEPREVRDQPWFFNQVVECETELFPRQVLDRLGRIERAIGRKRLVAKGPRMIDLDLLYFGDAVVKMEDLEVPHPRLQERRFVLEPLAELARDLRDPRTHKSVHEMLAAVKDQVVRKL